MHPRSSTPHWLSWVERAWESGLWDHPTCRSVWPEFPACAAASPLRGTRVCAKLGLQSLSLGHFEPIPWVNCYVRLLRLPYSCNVSSPCQSLEPFVRSIACVWTLRRDRHGRARRQFDTALDLGLPASRTHPA